MTQTPTSLHKIRLEIAALWKLAWPMLVGQLATVGMGVADVVMTGHQSANDLAAVALGNSLWVMVIVTVIGIMQAINPIVAHEVGAKNMTRLPHVVRQALWQGLGIGVLAALVLNCLTLVFSHLQLAPDVEATATTFVHVISLGLPALSMLRALNGYSTSLNQTKPIMVIAVAALLINILGNWLLIYGHYGFPKLNAVGCAVSTATGLWLSLAATIWWTHHAPAYRSSYPFSHWEWPHWPEIRNMLKIGLPIGVTYFAEVSAFASVGLLVARFGVVETGAHQIALNFTSLLFMVPMTLGIGMLTRVGHALGEGDPQRARFVGWVGIWLALAFGLFSALLIACCRYQIAAAYTNDPAVQELTAGLLIVAAVFQLSDSAQTAVSSAIRGYKVTRPPMIIHMISFWAIAVPLGSLLGLAPAWFPWSPAAPMGAYGYWIALAIGLTFAAVFLTWYFARLSAARAGAATRA